MSKIKKMISLLLAVITVISCFAATSISSYAASKSEFVWRSDGWHYVDSDGNDVKNRWYQVNNEWYHFNANGVMQTGWLYDNGKWYYLLENNSIKEFFTNKILTGLKSGQMVTGPVVIGEKAYYLDPDGSAPTGWRTFKVGNNSFTRYIVEGEIFKDGWLKVDKDYNDDSTNLVNNKKYWYFVDGTQLTGWKEINGKWYHFDSNGDMHVGFYGIDNKVYYFKRTPVSQAGEMVKYSYQVTNDNGTIRNSKGNVISSYSYANDYFYFNGSGHMMTGWICFNKNKSNEYWSYYRTNEEKDSNGRKHRSGSRVTGWYKIGSYWYYFNADGKMQTGWIKLNGIWYYLDSNGHMLTGRKAVSGKYYYFDASGAMQTGWFKFGNDWRYYSKDSNYGVGREVVGFKQIVSDYYFFNSNGVMISNSWTTYNGKRYYFKSDGRAAKYSNIINGNEYYFNGAGVMQTGWVKFSSNGKWKYYKPNGVMLKNTSQKIGNKTYRFDKNGWCTNP